MGLLKLEVRYGAENRTWLRFLTGRLPNLLCNLCSLATTPHSHRRRQEVGYLILWSVLTRKAINTAVLEKIAGVGQV